MVKLKKTGVEAKLAILLNKRSYKKLRPSLRILKSESNTSDFIRMQRTAFQGFDPGTSLC